MPGSIPAELREIAVLGVWLDLKLKKMGDALKMHQKCRRFCMNNQKHFRDRNIEKCSDC
jgi:hypothetical protein